VQNVAVLTNLARGRWTYENAGLLDATHLRFFALEGIEQLLIGAGLTLVHTTVVLNPPLDLNQVRETGNVFQDGNLTLSNLSRGHDSAVCLPVRGHCASRALTNGHEPCDLSFFCSHGALATGTMHPVDP